MLAVESEVKNRYNAQLETAQRTQAQEHHKAMSILNPLEEEQNDLNRQVEMLTSQLEFVDNLISNPGQNLNVKTIEYQQMLAGQKQTYISMFQERLNSRSYIYYKGDIIQLNSDNKLLFLRQFIDKLVIELHEHADVNWLSNGAIDLSKVKKQLQDRLTMRYEQAAHLLDERTKHGQRWLDFEEALGKKQHEIKQEREQKLKALGESLFAYACRGDLVSIKNCLNGKSLLEKSKLINERCHFDLNKTPLHFACLEGHIEVIAYLLANGGDVRLVDDNQFTPLHYAVMQNNANTESILELLHSHTKKMDDPLPLVHHAASYGRKILGIAAFHNNVAAIRWLLAHGAPINAKEEGSSPQRSALHIACWRGHQEVVRILLDEGANTKLLNANNETPLFEAVLAGQFNISQLFVDYGFWLNKKERELLNTIAKKSKPVAYVLKFISGFKFVVDILDDYQAASMQSHTAVGSASFWSQNALDGRPESYISSSEAAAAASGVKDSEVSGDSKERPAGINPVKK
jgi:ankyrin repeat protein